MGRLNKDGLKEKVIKQIEGLREEIIELSDRIHQNPELGFEEHQACAWLTDTLSAHGVLRLKKG